MKNRVNLTKGGREATDSYRINHLRDAVWTNELGRQLARRRAEWQVLG